MVVPPDSIMVSRKLKLGEVAGAFDGPAPRQLGDPSRPGPVASDLEVSMRDRDDFERAQPLILASYQAS